MRPGIHPIINIEDVSIEGALQAVGQIGALDRTAVRQQFETRFTAFQMAFKYLAVYEELVGFKRRKLVKTGPIAISRPTVDDPNVGAP